MCGRRRCVGVRARAALARARYAGERTSDVFGQSMVSGPTSGQSKILVTRLWMVMSGIVTVAYRRQQPGGERADASSGAVRK